MFLYIEYTITTLPFSIVVSWLHHQAEKILSPTPVSTPGEPPTSHGSHTPCTSVATHCFPLTPPSLTAVCCKRNFRRDSTTSSTTSSLDYGDRMEWLTYEVSVMPYCLLMRFDH